MKHEYFVRCAGSAFRWEVWFRYSYPDSDGREWKAVWGTRIYRYVTALRLCADLQAAHDAGFHLGNDQRYRPPGVET